MNMKCTCSLFKVIELRQIRNQEEQVKIPRACHINPTAAGHMGIKKSENRIIKHLTWPKNMKEMVYLLCTIRTLLWQLWQQKYLETGEELSASTVEQLASHRQGIIEEVKAKIEKAQDKQEVYDCKHTHLDAFQVGSQVPKEDFLHKKRPNGKRDTRCHGLYVITNNLGMGLYMHSH